MIHYHHTYNINMQKSYIKHKSQNSHNRISHNNHQFIKHCIKIQSTYTIVIINPSINRRQSISMTKVINIESLRRLVRTSQSQLVDSQTRKSLLHKKICITSKRNLSMANQCIKYQPLLNKKSSYLVCDSMSNQCLNLH